MVLTSIGPHESGAEPGLACSLTDTQAEIGAAARRYLTDRYPPGKIAELADRGEADVAAWADLGRQGWLDADLGVVELTVLAEESGRALHPAPWLITAALAAPVYHAAGTGLPGPATLARGGRASAADGGWELDGYLSGVPGLSGAAEVLVVAHVADGQAVFGVRPDGPGVSRTRLAGIDPLRDGSDLVLAAAPARLLARPGLAGPLLAEIEDRTTAMLAGEAVGVAARAVEFAVEYAKVREQFGRPIGSFQAVAHQLADSYADVELARSLAYGAAFAVAAGDPGADLSLTLAGQASSGAALRACETAIQACGAMGVTWEFPLHWWYRRALWLDAFHAARGDPLGALADAVLGDRVPDAVNEDLTCH
jgi:alkylation response protein AidB-like acyl-CoA dehydrogenase